MSGFAGKVPPHDLDAEAAVLSALMLENVHRKVQAILPEPRVLYSEANQRILEGIWDLKKNGQPTDVVTVMNWLKAKGWIARVGGSAYLGQIIDATPAVSNVESHARIVLEKHRLRTLISACHEIAADAYGGVEDVGKFLTSTSAKMRSICSTKDRVAGRSGADIMQEIFADITSDEPEDIEGAYTGIWPIDRATGVMRPGSVTTVLAYSSHGKSALCAGLVDEATCHGSGRARCDNCHTTFPNPWRQAYFEKGPLGEPDYTKCPRCKSDNTRAIRAGAIVFSGEMRDVDYGRRIAQIRSGVNLRAYKNRRRAGTVPQEHEQAVLQSINELALDSLWIDDKTIDVDGIGAVIEAKRWEFAEKGIELTLVVIDYAQRVKVKKFRGQRREELAEAGRVIKGLAKEHNVAIVLPAQLNEEARKRGIVPNAENVREAQDIVMDSDNVIVIYAPYRDEAVNTDLTKPQQRFVEPVQYRLGKTRDGMRGHIPGGFRPDITRFSAWDPKWGEWELPEKERPESAERDGQRNRS